MVWRLDTAKLLAQIGPKMLSAVGAQGFQSDTREDATGYLAFVVSPGHRMVYIHLADDDTYTVQTKMIRSGKAVFERKGVSAEDISEAVWQAHLEP